MLLRRLRYFLQRGRRQAELRTEMESHIQERAAELRDSGLNEADARASAKRLFGNLAIKHEDSREIWISRHWSEFWGDLHHAARLVRRAPGFALCVIASMAIGIAAATTVFSIVDPLLFRSLPFQDGDRLVSVGVSGPIDTNEFSMGNMYFEWRDRQTAFSSLTSMRPGTQCDIQFSQTQRVACVAIESNFLTTLGVAPALGRNFTQAEDQPKAPLTAVISDHLWHSAFGGRFDIVGQIAQVDDRPARIIGVLTTNFVLPQGADVDVLLPAQIDESLARTPQATIFLRAFARLKPGISVVQARQRMEPLFRATVSRYVPPELKREVRPVIRSVRDRSIQEAKLASWLLLGAVLFLLLLACLTIANLLLARSVARSEEFSMRAALGAAQTRLFRQSLTETMFLGIAGGITGCLLSILLLRALVLWAPGGFFRLEQAHIDRRVFVFSLLISTLSAAMAGLIPALRKPTSTLIQSTRLTRGPRLLLRQILVVVQLACSLVLLTAALLFGRSLQNLEMQRTGFSEEKLYAAPLALSHRRYAQSARLNAFYAQLETKLQSIPGITSLALSDSMPPAGGMHGRPLANMKVAGHGSVAGAAGMVSFRYVSPNYFRTLGIPILLGRGFSNSDREDQSSLVVSESLARRLFGSADPISQRISLDGGITWVTVVGVAQDVKNNGLDVPAWPEYYRLRTPRSDQLGYSAVALLRTDVDRSTVETWVRREVAQLDTSLPVKLIDVAQRVHDLTDRPRFLTLILTAFALTSLLLAGTGLFGVIAYLVTTRTREIGIRSALGASRFDVVLFIQKQTAFWTMLGILIGLSISLSFAHLIRGMLFGVAPTDPLILGSAVLTFLLIAATAAWRPSSRAGKIDPAITLRSE